MPVSFLFLRRAACWRMSTSLSSCVSVTGTRAQTCWRRLFLALLLPFGSDQRSLPKSKNSKATAQHSKTICFAGVAPYPSGEAQRSLPKQQLSIVKLSVSCQPEVGKRLQSKIATKRKKQSYRNLVLADGLMSASLHNLLC